MHQHLIEVEKAFRGGGESLSMAFFVPFPDEMVGGGKAEKVATDGVGNADVESRDAVADFHVDVKAGDFVAPELPYERHNEAFGEERRIAEGKEFTEDL